MAIISGLSGITALTYKDRNNANARSMFVNACSQISRVQGSGANIGYAASICFSKHAGSTEFLLVNTTHGRRMLPKGVIRTSERPEESALRSAYSEGGVIGEISSSDIFNFRHLKDDDMSIQNVIAYVVSTQHQGDVAAVLRDPKWYNLEDAKAALFERRRFEFATEIHTVLLEANEAIDRNDEKVEQVCAIPFREASHDLDLVD